MAKEEEMKEMKKKFAQVMDKMGGLQMGTTEVTSGQIGDKDILGEAIETHSFRWERSPRASGMRGNSTCPTRRRSTSSDPPRNRSDGGQRVFWLAEETLCAPLPPH